MNTKLIAASGIFMSLWLIPPMSPLHSRTAKHVAAKRGRREQKPVVPPVGVPVLTTHAGVAASADRTARVGIHKNTAHAPRQLPHTIVIPPVTSHQTTMANCVPW